MSLDKAIEYGKEKRKHIKEQKLLLVLAGIMVAANGIKEIDFIGS